MIRRWWSETGAVVESGKTMDHGHHHHDGMVIERNSQTQATYVIEHRCLVTDAKPFIFFPWSIYRYIYILLLYFSLVGALDYGHMTI